MRTKINVKTIAAKNKRVNQAQLEESLEVTRTLLKSGFLIRRGYNLRSPFETRLIKTSAAELLALQK